MNLYIASTHLAGQSISGSIANSPKILRHWINQPKAFTASLALFCGLEKLPLAVPSLLTMY
ncbi:MAG: hypothetical protein V3U57_04420 [Robiginitomaculum sp.]